MKSQRTSVSEPTSEFEPIAPAVEPISAVEPAQEPASEVLENSSAIAPE